MTRLLEAELIKLRTTRTFAALAGVAVAISLLITVLVAILTEPSQDEVLTDVFNSDVSGLFILILAVLGITGEWRHRTITSSLLAAPDRLRFLAAKTLAFAAAGVVLSLLIAVAVAHRRGSPSSRSATCRPRSSASGSARCAGTPWSRRCGAAWESGSAHSCATRPWPWWACS